MRIRMNEKGDAGKNGILLYFVKLFAHPDGLMGRYGKEDKG